MNESYEDIRSRIPEPPTWFDEEAVPRYCSFHPTRCADIYADEAALVEISCQACGTHFLVAFSSQYVMNTIHRMNSEAYWKLETGEQRLDWIEAQSKTPLADSIQDGSIHYGDPPNTGCCPAGPTMNCEDLRVCEYWSRNNQQHEWKRNPAFEIVLDTIYEI